MEKKINKNWWFLAINGVVAILFGVLLLFFSQEIIELIIFYAGLIILITGIILLIGVVRQVKQEKNVTLLVIQSVVAISLGLIMLIFRNDTARFLLIMIGVWALIIGIFQLIILINIPKSIKNKNVLLFNGLLTIALGVFLIVKPLEFASIILTIVGVLSLLFGIGMIYMAFMIRNIPVVVAEESRLS